MKKQIKLWLLILPLAMLSSTLSAQHSKQRPSREQLAEAQAKHIANEMEMDGATSKRFIDAYCEFQREIWALGPRPKRQASSMTEEETEQALKNRFTHSQKILDIRQKYYTIYSEFLTPKQIQRVYELENQMMKRLAGQGRRPAKRNR